MPSYDVVVTLEMNFPGGEARGRGNNSPATVGDDFKGSGYEVQLIRITCKIGCSDATIAKLAITQARKAIVSSAAKYHWVDKGLQVNTVNADIIARYP